jgi:hypothetical protein
MTARLPWRCNPWPTTRTDPVARLGGTTSVKAQSSNRPSAPYSAGTAHAAAPSPATDAVRSADATPQPQCR